MPDMLVKLYTLPDVAPLLARQRAAGVDIRRALAPEKHLIVDWVRQRWQAGWANECEVAFAREPVACFIAVEHEQVIGFGCHDVTCKNFFGPTGVAEAARGRGIGAALLLSCMHAMAAQGYGYAIIGAAGPTDFYTRIVGATVIPDSWPGVYRGLLRSSPATTKESLRDD